jgi:hypothetical protein
VGTSIRIRSAIAVLLAGYTIAGGAPAPARAEDAAEAKTPPRLSLVEGDVSFWRPGSSDWEPARINIALAPGDLLSTGPASKLELQVGARAFVRAGADTEFGLDQQEPDYVQFKVTTGHVAVDLRALRRGHAVAIDTPHAAFTVERTGYYRLDVSQTSTAFGSRRGGRATVTPAGGAPSDVEAGEEVVVEGATARVAVARARQLDDWDRWNYDRTDRLLNAASARYVSDDMYGVDALDRYGHWRVVTTYGRVWVPDAVPPAWAPYSTGRWLWDTYYGWTWVDEAPWGWAPYHYGRWVYLSSYWAWAPGPVVVAPVYAPALVAFFGGSGLHIGVSVPFISWVALGWGEPLVPWWGPVGFIGVPCWAGWGGPRVVNRVVVNHTTVVNVNNISVYENVHVRHAVAGVPRDQFNRHGAEPVRLATVDPHRLDPVRGALPARPRQTSAAPPSGHERRPTGLVDAGPAADRRPRAAGVRHGAPDRGAPPVGASPDQPAEPRRPHSRVAQERFVSGRGNVPEQPHASRPPHLRGTGRSAEDRQPIGTGPDRRSQPGPLARPHPRVAHDRSVFQHGNPPQGSPPSSPPREAQSAPPRTQVPPRVEAPDTIDRAVPHGARPAVPQAPIRLAPRGDGEQSASEPPSGYRQERPGAYRPGPLRAAPVPAPQRAPAGAPHRSHGRLPRSG